MSPAPLLLGAGDPVTLVAHGLGGSATETRPLAGGLPGTRVLPEARGHGCTPLGHEPVDHDLLGRDLEAVADAFGVTQALGVSMGAGALLSMLARRPDRFARVVLYLPAALDTSRTDEAVGRTTALAQALDDGDEGAVAALVAAEVPADLGRQAEAYVRARTRFLLASPGLPAVLRALPASAPVADRSRLAAVTAEVLVLAQEGDPLHPAQVAREIAAVLPRARLHLFARPGAALRERAALRELIVGALTPA